MFEQTTEHTCGFIVSEGSIEGLKRKLVKARGNQKKTSCISKPG